MDGASLIFFAVLGIVVLLIIVTLGSIMKLGDERSDYIKKKAQSYTLSGVIGWMLYEVGKSIYSNIWSDGSYQGINPFVVLVVISVIYLITLLILKKKYGG